MNNLTAHIKELFNTQSLNYNLLTQEYSYANKNWLLLLWLLPVFLLIYILKDVFSKKIAISSINQSLKFRFITLLRFLPPIILSISLFFFIIALARPQKHNTTTEHFTEGIDILLTLDISGSMEYLDFKPNRLEAAKEVCAKFIEGRKTGNKSNDNIGLVVFAGEAYSKTPLTTDYDLLLDHLKSVSTKDIENQGTAIGNALAVATDRIRKSEGKSKIIVLISDGENSAGNIDPVSAVQLAYAFGIKVYAIGIGKDGKVPVKVKTRSFFGEEVETIQYVENSFNESQLKTIAAIGKGSYFRATNNSNLKEIFEDIDKLEKSQIKSRSYQNFSDFFHIYIFWGIAFLLLWFAFKASFITNAIYD